MIMQKYIGVLNGKASLANVACESLSTTTAYPSDLQHYLKF